MKITNNIVKSLFLMMLACMAAFGQKTPHLSLAFAPPTGSGTNGMAAVWNSSSVLTASGSVLYADKFTGGTDACDKISKAIAALPSSSGTVDARGLTGGGCAVNPLANLVSTSGSSGVLLLGNLTYTTSQPWVIPNGWSVIGNGPASTIIKAANSSVSPVIVFNMANSQGVRVERLTVDCNSSNQAAIGIQNSAATDLSGAFDVNVLNCSQYGVDWSSYTAMNSSIRNVFVGGNMAATSTAMRINDIAMRSVRDLTISPSNAASTGLLIVGTGTGTAGAVRGSGTFANIRCHNVTTCVSATNGAQIDLSDVAGDSSVSTVVNLDNTVHDTNLRNLAANGASSTLFDASFNSGDTFSGSSYQYIGFYSIGSGGQGNAVRFSSAVPTSTASTAWFPAGIMVGDAGGNPTIADSPTAAWTVGSGVPSTICSASTIGSLYTRMDSNAGQNAAFYVCIKCTGNTGNCLNKSNGYIWDPASSN